MEGFLNNSPKFNNSLSDLLFLTFSIKTVSFRSFLLLQIAKIHCFQPLYNKKHICYCYSISSFSTVHYIPKYSKDRRSVCCVLGKSSNFGLFLDFFTRSSPSSNIIRLNPICKTPIVSDFQRILITAIINFCCE